MHSRLEQIAIKVCERLPLNLTIYATKGECTKIATQCSYCSKQTDHIYLCTKKTYHTQENISFS